MRWFDIEPSSIEHILITHQDTDHVGAVGQDSKGLFGKAFPGMHILGYVLSVVAIAMITGSVVIGVWDGIQREYGFLRFLIRSLIMLEGYKIWDMLFLDNYLLKEQLLKLLVIFPAVSLVIAGLCVLIGNWI